jgi:photosystem II stability/assembly factor-like uncharacterized protein
MSGARCLLKEEKDVKSHSVCVILGAMLAAMLVVPARAAGSAASEPPVESASALPAGHFETPFSMPWGRLAASHTGVLFMYNPEGLTSFRSGDGGYMWEMLNATADATVNDIAASPAGSPEDLLFWSQRSNFDQLRISSPDGRTWRSPLQPPNGQVTQIAVSPFFAVDGTLYAAALSYSNQYLWRSTDRGDHWQAINSPGTSRITKIALSPNLMADKTLFVSLGDDTVWRSTDAGDSWQRADSGLGASDENRIRDLVAGAQGQGNIVLMVTLDHALKVSTDRGDTWATRSSYIFSSLFVAPDFATTHAIYGLEGEYLTLRRSTDLGKTWDTVTPWIGAVSGLAFSPNYAQDRTIYAASGSDAIWASRDGGATWTPSPARHAFPWSSTAWQVQVIAPPDLDQDNLLLAARRSLEHTDVAFRSTDGGRTWQQLKLPAAGEDLWLAISPTFAQDHAVFVVIDTHLYKSTDAGDHWVQLGDSLPSSFFSLIPSPAYAQDHTFFGFQPLSGAFLSEDDGETWTPISGTQNVTDFDVSPGYPDDPTFFVCRYNDGIFRSDDGGDTWTGITNQLGVPAWNVGLSPTFPQDGIVFAVVTGSSAGGVYRSDNRGDSWTNVTSGGPENMVSYLSLSPRFEQDQTIMVGTDSHAPYLSEDKGQTWHQLQGVPGIGGSGRKPNGLLTYESGRLLPLATTPDAVYRYWWPDLYVSSSPVRVCLEPGAVDPDTVHLSLEPTDAAPVSWVAESQAAWLSTDPVTGTLPAILALGVDPGLVSQDAQTNLKITISWSLRTITTYTVPVFVYTDCRGAWLPNISKTAAGQ